MFTPFPDESSNAPDWFIEPQRIPRLVADVVELALQEFLQREGFSVEK